jgi:hypothetical protein
MKIEAVASGRYQPAAVARTSAGTGEFAAALKNAVSGGNGLDDVFERASQTYGVPENLLKAVAKAESGFQADAVSRCGAQGIMQLMPSTAKSLGVEDPFDPEQNIMGGAKCLGSLLGKYGDAKLALAAYNAGSGNVEKYGGVPPFTETQNYVEKVLSYAGGNVSIPVSGKSGTASGMPSAGASALSAWPTVSFTADDYRRFLELFSQQLLERTLSLSDSGDELQARQDAFLM